MWMRAEVSSNITNHFLVDGAMDSMARVGMRGSGFAVGGFVAMKCATIFDHEHYDSTTSALYAMVAGVTDYSKAQVVHASSSMYSTVKVLVN
ncbi:hypothetical protein PR003_g17014 [Phytophthora rubi]|uniref:Uncharacterized protein n=1 Tax=Phytophthora rubi TaxID=129364 RepID=A0A6A4EI85_9STRA|nr:hypothetical protein PF003_g19641 [Phytophthora fragariae]KAE9323241.1 hypothetical protein PR003_g17014 [Phytophthora rubi]